MYEDLFGKLSTDTSLPRQSTQLSDDRRPEEMPTISKSAMQGYKSALKNYHTCKGWDFSASDTVPGNLSLDKWIDKFIKGYAREIAEKKSSGIMKINEGKSALFKI
jgi:hypothetical protein